MDPVELVIARGYYGIQPTTQRFDYNASNQVIYHGIAVRGAASTASQWQIVKFTYTGNNVTLIQSAPRNSVWDDRTSLVYV